MMKKIISAVALMLALAGLLVSCSKPEADAPVTDKDNEIPVVNSEKTEEGEKEEQTAPSTGVNVKPLPEYDEKVVSEAAAALGFENTKLFAAFANAVGVAPEKLTEDDVDKVHYIAIGPEANGTYAIYIGHVDYVDLCLSDKTEAVIVEELKNVVMISEFNYNKDSDSIADIAKFKNIEMFEIYESTIDDVSFLKNYQSLIFGYFRNNGITDVSSLSDYDPESLRELDFTGNSISDWSYLEHIKEKIIVSYSEKIMKDGNGNDVDVPFILTLEDKLAQEAEKAAQAGASEVEDKSSSEMTLVDENGEQVDFSSLFE